MRATVCELPYQPALLEPAWEALATHVRHEGAELVLLPEFAFVEPVWESTPFDPGRWAAAVALSDAWMARLNELGAVWVVGARPVTVAGRHYNQGFIWSAEGGLPAAAAQVLPAPGARWLGGHLVRARRRPISPLPGRHPGLRPEHLHRNLGAGHACRLCRPGRSGPPHTARHRRRDHRQVAGSGHCGRRAHRCLQPFVEPGGHRRPHLRWRRLGDQSRWRPARTDHGGAAVLHRERGPGACRCRPEHLPALRVRRACFGGLTLSFSCLDLSHR